MPVIHISTDDIESTLQHLQRAGHRSSECVVLWLGRNSDDAITVKQVYRPTQITYADMFRIPPASMRLLLAELHSAQLMIAAQVHSHPFEAFHSQADDAWAIVRHVNALSLVVPEFALKTSVKSFIQDTKVFRLAHDNKWCAVGFDEIAKWLVIH